MTTKLTTGRKWAGVWVVYACGSLLWGSHLQFATGLVCATVWTAADWVKHS